MRKWGILLPFIITALLCFMGCQLQDLSAYALKTDTSAPTGKCLDCHAATPLGAQGALAGASLTNATLYASSGHTQGLRVLDSAGLYEFEKAEENSAGCTKCHTTNGFIAWSAGPAPVVVSGTTAYDAYANASIAMAAGSNDVVNILQSCNTCHDPHSRWEMNVRNLKPVTMASSNNSALGAPLHASTTKVFDKGLGNICANCHQDRRPPATKQIYFTGVAVPVSPATAVDISTSTTKKYVVVTSSGTGATFAKGGTPHVGVQSDFLLGIGSAASVIGASTTYSTFTTGYTASAAFTTSPHYTQDSCVSCHISLGDHSMYLTDQSTGGSGDKLTSCQPCHASASALGVPGSTKLWDNSATTFTTGILTSQLLGDIQVAKATLLNYLADKNNFYGATRLLNDLNTDGKISTDILGTIITGYVGTVTSAPASGSAVNVPEDNDGKVYWTGLSSPPGATILKNGTLILAKPADYGPVAAPDTDANGNQVAFSPGFTSTSSMLNGKDWSTSTSNLYLTVPQAQAYFNFMLFVRDHSEGIHNPKYAAQLLYDAISLLGLTQPGNWTSRP